MKTNNTIIGILGGVAIGAIAGILFAPDKGTNTRKKITKKSTDLADDLKVKLDNITSTLSEKYNSLVKLGEELVDKETDMVNMDNIKKMNKGFTN